MNNEKASGNLIVVLNGTRIIGALSNQSTFFRYELPFLNSSKIHAVKAVILHRPGYEKYETCREPKTLKILENILNEKNIHYECEDNPFNILGLFCFEDSFSKECQSVKYLSSSVVKNDIKKINLLIVLLIHLSLIYI
jgi:hypothetical protein